MAGNDTAKLYVQTLQLCDNCSQFLTSDNFPTQKWARESSLLISCLPYAWRRQCWRAREIESDAPGIADGATEEKAPQQGCLY